MTATDAAISHAGAAPRMIRPGIVIGAVNGMNAQTCASVPSGSLVDREPGEERDQDQHRQRRGGALELLLARHERAGDREQRPRRTRSRAGTTRAPARSRRAGRRRRPARPVTAATATPSTAISSSWPSPSSPRPITLPASRSLRLDRGQQHLDHPRGLLLHDARRDPVAVGQQLAVEHQDREEGQAGLGVAVGVDRLDGHDLSGGRALESSCWLATCSRSTSVSSGSSCERICAADEPHVRVGVGDHRPSASKRLGERDRALGDRRDSRVGRDRVLRRPAEAQQRGRDRRRG